MIVFWTPISHESGFGHFYRLLGLHEKLQKIGFLVSYFTNEKSYILPEKNVNVLHLFTSNIDDISNFLISFNTKILIVDYYNVTKNEIEYLKTKFKIVYFDSYFINPQVDIIINFNPFAKERIHLRNENTKYFLGMEYNLPREKLFKVKNDNFEKDTIFICIGGTDLKRVTFDMIEYLPRSFKYKIILGKGCEDNYINEIRKRLNEFHVNYDLYSQPDNFFEIMNSCEYAITSCSTIVYEMSFFDKAFICINVISNQDKLEEFLSSENIKVIKRTNLNALTNMIINKEFKKLNNSFKDKSNDLVQAIGELYYETI